LALRKAVAYQKLRFGHIGGFKRVGFGSNARAGPSLPLKEFANNINVCLEPDWRRDHAGQPDR
jgi:hypothetical protein